MFHRRPPHLRQPNTYESLMSRGVHLYVSEPEELQSRSISFVDSLRSRIGGRSLGAAIDMASADLPPEIRRPRRGGGRLRLSQNAFRRSPVAWPASRDRPALRWKDDRHVCAGRSDLF